MEVIIGEHKAKKQVIFLVLAQALIAELGDKRGRGR
jgi:hypothetical protein